MHMFSSMQGVQAQLGFGCMQTLVMWLHAPW